MDGECFEHFLQELSRQGGKDEVHLLILDNAGAHKNRSIRWPHDVFALYLPTYATELNPIERLWLEMRRALKYWYHDLDSLRRDLDVWSNAECIQVFHDTPDPTCELVGEKEAGEPCVNHIGCQSGFCYY